MSVEPACDVRVGTFNPVSLCPLHLPEEERGLRLKQLPVANDLTSLASLKTPRKMGLECFQVGEVQVQME